GQDRQEKPSCLSSPSRRSRRSFRSRPSCHSSLSCLRRPPFLPFARACYAVFPPMDETQLTEPQQGEAQIPAEPAPPITSRFLFVDVAALRAKQLRRGARQRLGDEVPQVPHKAERVAMEEVRRGLVYYNVPAPKRAGVEGEA